MRKVTCYALAAVGLALVLQACALGAVTVTWAGGGPVNLTLITNPDAARESWWPQVWYGELPIDMPTLGPIVFTGTGNFNNTNGTAVNVIRIKQVVTNQTDEKWTDFHVGITGGSFYKKWLIQSGWSMKLTNPQVDFYANGGPLVAPGQLFSDGLVFTVVPDSNGNASFTLTKWATVPEAGSATALMTGLVGLLAFFKRRKA